MFNLMPYSRRNDNISRKDDWFGLDRFFDDFFKDPFFARVSAVTAPIRADVKETDKEYIVEAELAGVNKDDILIDLRDDILTLGVDVKNETNKEDDGYIYRERQSGSYRRSFHVQNIKNEDVKASFKDGLLVITLPKAEPGSRTKQIQIE
jgi:HSP20 family protein